MKLFNTLTQTVDQFKPLSNTVLLYVCGVTPYDTTHLGHAFTYVTYDTLSRYLEYIGYKVRFVENVTDIDDDILRKAKEKGMDWQELGNREVEHFLKDMDALNVKRPAVYAKASEEVADIIKINEKLIKDGLAYTSGNNVYYSVKQDTEFGALAKAVGIESYSQMLEVANERGNFPKDKWKKDPLDFVLWQAQAPGEPAWESPWGLGRPGWHIECSAIAMHYLGTQIDIHGGGSDLIFPHHTCEIAQSEHFTGLKPFSQVWMHTAMVYQDGEKMSKSLGNLTLVSHLLDDYAPDVIRALLQSKHYRESWEATALDYKNASTLIDKFKDLRFMVQKEEVGIDHEVDDAFKSAMENDLQTPLALQILAEGANKALKDKNTELGSQVLQLTDVLGLRIF